MRLFECQRGFDLRAQSVRLNTGPHCIADYTVAVDNDGRRQALYAKSSNNAIVRSIRIADAKLTQMSVRLFGGIGLVNAEEHDILLLKVQPGLLQAGSFGTAWPAPACPEVDHDNLALQVSQPVGCPVIGVERNVWRSVYLIRI
jgi:hypothetical protein